ncbi:unnamed protein product, partial [Rhizoctonia solani]
MIVLVTLEPTIHTLPRLRRNRLHLQRSRPFPLSLLTNDGLLAQFGCELCGCPRETSLTRSTCGYGLSLRPGRSTGLRLVPHYGQWATP